MQKTAQQACAHVRSGTLGQFICYLIVWTVVVALMAPASTGQSQASSADDIIPIPMEPLKLEAPPVSVIAPPSFPKQGAKLIELQPISFRKPAPAPNAVKTGLPFSMSGEQALHIGNALVLDADPEGGLPYLQEAVKQSLNSFEAQKGLADCNYLLHHDDEAVAGYNEALKSAPEVRESGSAVAKNEEERVAQIGQVRFNLGDLYLAHDRFAEASTAFTEALKLKTGDPDTLTGLGVSLLRQGRSGEALPYLILVSTMQSFSADALYNLGEAYAGESDWLPAAEAFEKAAAIKKNWHEPYFNRGVMLYNADRLQDAVNAFMEAKKLKVDHLESSIYLADAHNRLGHPTEAIAYYREVLKKKPNDVPSLVNLAYLCLKSNQYGEAEQRYQELLSVEPQRPDASANLAALLSRHNFERKTGITLRPALQANANNAEVRINLGAQLIAESVFAEAVQVLQAAVALKPNSAAAHFNLGLAQYKAGDQAGAVASISKALELRPGWAEAYNNLGMAYSELKQWEDAAKAFQEAIKLIPGYAGAHYNLGIAYVNLGQGALAAQQVEILRPLSRDLPSRLSFKINQMSLGQSKP